MQAKDKEIEVISDSDSTSECMEFDEADVFQGNFVQAFGNRKFLLTPTMVCLIDRDLEQKEFVDMLIETKERMSKIDCPAAVYNWLDKWFRHLFGVDYMGAYEKYGFAVLAKYESWRKGRYNNTEEFALENLYKEYFMDQGLEVCPYQSVVDYIRLKDAVERHGRKKEIYEDLPRREEGHGMTFWTTVRAWCALPFVIFWIGMKTSWEKIVWFKNNRPRAFFTAATFTVAMGVLASLIGIMKALRKKVDLESMNPSTRRNVLVTAYTMISNSMACVFGSVSKNEIYGLADYVNSLPSNPMKLIKVITPTVTFITAMTTPRWSKIRVHVKTFFATLHPRGNFEVPQEYREMMEEADPVTLSPKQLIALKLPAYYEMDTDTIKHEEFFDAFDYMLKHENEDMGDFTRFFETYPTMIDEMRQWMVQGTNPLEGRVFRLKPTTMLGQIWEDLGSQVRFLLIASLFTIVFYTILFVMVDKHHCKQCRISTHVVCADPRCALCFAKKKGLDCTHPYCERKGTSHVCVQRANRFFIVKNEKPESWIPVEEEPKFRDDFADALKKWGPADGTKLWVDIMDEEDEQPIARKKKKVKFLPEKLKETKENPMEKGKAIVKEEKPLVSKSAEAKKETRRKHEKRAKKFREAQKILETNLYLYSNRTIQGVPKELTGKTGPWIIDDTRSLTGLMIISGKNSNFVKRGVSFFMDTKKNKDYVRTDFEDVLKRSKEALLRGVRGKEMPVHLKMFDKRVSIKHKGNHNGGGFPVREYIVTAHHVVDTKTVGDEVEMECKGRGMVGELVAVDADLDLALITKPTVDTDGQAMSLRSYKLNTEYAEVDTKFTLIYNAGEGDKTTSGRVRKIDDTSSEHNASTEPGASGECLIAHTSGNLVIGMHVAGSESGNTFVPSPVINSFLLATAHSSKASSGEEN